MSVNASAPIRVHALISSLTWGGAEMLLADFAGGAPAAGVELSVGYLQDLDGSPAAERLRKRGIEPLLVPITGLLNVGDLRRVRRHLAGVAPDVLHTHLGNADFMGGLAAHSLGIPTVSTIHVVERESGVRDVVASRLIAAVRRRSATAVIAPSEAARRALIAEGIDTPDRILTVHNGVAARPRPGVGRELRRSLGLEPDDLVVATVSVLRPGKGHDVALAAIESLGHRFPKLRLLIVGDGPARPEIAGAAVHLGEKVVMTGHRDDVIDILDAVDVLVHPTHADVFPTILLEAMAAAVPVVATRVGGVGEIVEDGRTGILIEPPPKSASVASALTRLLMSPELRRGLGQRGRERFEREFGAETWAGRMRRIYEDALATTRPGTRSRGRGARTSRSRPALSDVESSGGGRAPAG